MGCLSKGFVIPSKQCLVYQRNILVHEILALIVFTLDRRKSKTLLTIDEDGSKIANTVFAIAICRHSGNKWQEWRQMAIKNIVSNDF